MLSNYDYHCPHCSTKLSKEEGVHFFVENTNQQKANFYLSPYPGVYRYSSDTKMSVSKGEKVYFYCFSCDKNLQSEKHPKFVEIDLKVSDQIYFKVYFSPICGEQLTYVEMQGELEKYEESFLVFHQQRKKAV